ncbi:MAG: 16S rRNA (guanine(966)-N(2))-methyltransferase RsmD [Planctomycetes bacterium]|nr:16S rRNA (guanine(966)-N(2))-methyltransferase RsmD [Planctomycetota bacterium]
MKIISGFHRGRPIETLEGLSTRPPLEHTRAAIFNTLHERVKKANVLDLFAGSGSMGLEALSRGAAACHFVEINHRALKTLKRNIKSFDYEQISSVFQEKVPGVLHSLKDHKYDLIFIDPPFDAMMMGQFLRLENDCASLLSENGLIIIRFPENAPIISTPSQMSLYKEKVYGISHMKYFTHPKED